MCYHLNRFDVPAGYQPEVVHYQTGSKTLNLYLSMTRGCLFDLLMSCGYGAVNVQLIETSINKLSMENQFWWRRKKFLIQTL